MIKINDKILLFLAPIIWSILFILFMILGDALLGPGKLSGKVIGIIYAFLLAPFIGIAGIIYAVRSYAKHSNILIYLAIAMNISLILSGILIWLTWYGII